MIGIISTVLVFLYGCACFPGCDDPYEYDPNWFPANPPECSSVEFFTGALSGVLFGAIVGSMLVSGGRRRR